VETRVSWPKFYPAGSLRVAEFKVHLSCAGRVIETDAFPTLRPSAICGHPGRHVITVFPRRIIREFHCSKQKEISGSWEGWKSSAQCIEPLSEYFKIIRRNLRRSKNFKTKKTISHTWKIDYWKIGKSITTLSVQNSNWTRPIPPHHSGQSSTSYNQLYESPERQIKGQD
jgi:hypothetical protein